MQASPNVHRVVINDRSLDADDHTVDEEFNNIAEKVTKSGDDEVIMELQHYGVGCKQYSIVILVLGIVLMLFFIYAIVEYQFLSHRIDTIQYILAETFANLFIIIFTICIYIGHIYMYKAKGQGRMEGRNCTNFDVYATFSLLWFWMNVLSYLTYGDAVYGVVSLVRMLSIIAPGVIHQTYIRLIINDEYKAQHFIYLGDIMIYKMCCIVFLSLQLFSNVVQLPLNAEFFQDSISDIFHLDDESDIFHFPFIIASVFGRPFVSILNFHLLILYLTWFVNGDKPATHHNLDSFALTMHDDGLNVVFGVAVMILYVIDVIFSHYIWYRSVILLAYFVSSIYHFYFLFIEGRKTHQRMSIIMKKHKEHARIDAFTIFESSFVLMGGVLACLLYIANIDDFEKKFDAFSELSAWSLFMISQYIFVIFIQFDYVYGRKLLMRQSTQKMLSCSALISAVSITFLFSFEYAHFVEFLTHHDDHGHHESVTLTVSYALFWCLIEYFIWSFVAINHMLHHVHHIEHQAQMTQIERHRVSVIVNEMHQQKKKRKKKKLGANASITPPSPSISSSYSLSPHTLAVNVMKSKAYQNTLIAPSINRTRTPSYLFVELASKPSFDLNDYNENDNND